MKKILVVDDEEIQRFTIQTALEDLTDMFDITCVESGQKCINYLKNNKLPDLLILDVMMPEMNGWELFNEIKKNENWKQIKIIFLTAQSNKDMGDSTEFFVDDYIEKPFDVQDLKNRIDKILEN